jgi:hypothetical protein
MAQANLIALSKGADDVRPIAMGCVDRKLVSKCLSKHFREEMQLYFTPLQFGVGVQGGIETIRHYAGALLQEKGDQWAVLQVDFSNAYNSIVRKACIQEVLTHFRVLLPYLRETYNPKASLWTDTGESGRKASLIQSEEGAQQGDPLGPFMFAMGLQPALVQAKSTLEGLNSPGCILAYLDDVVLVGPPEHIQQAFNTLVSACERIGLRCNPTKCCFLPPAGTDPQRQTGCIPQDVPLVSDGIRLLGSPLRNDTQGFEREWCRQHVSELLEKELEEIKELANCNPQEALSLLRLCYVPKITHLIRSVNPNQTEEAVSLHDRSV